MADDIPEEDLFADLYDADDTEPQAAPSNAAPVIPEPEPVALVPSLQPAAQNTMSVPTIAASSDLTMTNGNGEAATNGHQSSFGKGEGGDDYRDDNYGPIGIKEDGKMFIGGLNWETTDQSLKDYFSEFGEVLECTVMRDAATGRSRGFGFLTFKDPKTVNTVMVKEHYLDGKIIDPKRAIPREEQERTSKIFVGGVSQEATERDFKEFFMQFGRVIDATLMMDKDTGRPRGFGFVTFDGDEAVDRTLAGPLEIHGKPIEVKRAQPRGNMHDDDRGGKFGRRGDKFARGGQDNNQQGNQGFNNQQDQNQNSTQTGPSPAMMAQYWQRMQQYFAVMQQQMSAMNQANQANQANQMNPMMAAMGGQMNPAMMQQMMAAQQQQQRGQGALSPGNGTPNANSPGPNNQGMSPAMMQQMQHMQMQQMQQMQMQNPQGAQTPSNGDTFSPPGGPGGAASNRAGFNAQEQLMFEQQKYERQQVQRMQQNQQYAQNYGGGGTWEGMYDDVPAPNMQQNQGGGGRGGFHGGHGGGGKWQNRNRGGGGQGHTPPVQPSNAPANAPTGPKNAGRPGANYRGGGRGGNRGWRPY